jgi:hypothetical protein
MIHLVCNNVEVELGQDLKLKVRAAALDMSQKTSQMQWGDRPDHHAIET